MSEIDYGRLERAIMDGMGYANSSHSPEDLRRERNYKILQAAAVIYGAALQHGLDVEQVARQKRPFEVFVNDAVALLEEIEKRNP